VLSLLFGNPEIAAAKSSIFQTLEELRRAQRIYAYKLLPFRGWVMTEPYTLEEHFAGKSPRTHLLYDRILRMLESFGAVVADPKKTCIHIVRRTALAGIRVRSDYLLLEFKTDYPIDSPALVKTEQISRNRYHHTIKVDSPDVLTDEVRAWLRDAYELSA
jgi:hypothetical protein